MLPKKHRMKEREVKRAMKRGKPTFGRFFTFVAFPNRYEKCHRMGIVVSGKHTKSAVLRNTFRRSIYECADASIRNSSKPNKDIVLITKKGIKIDKEFIEKNEYQQDIEINLKKILQ